MKNKKLKGFFLLVFASLILVGCSGEAKEFEDDYVDSTAEVGEFFDIDNSNSIKVNASESKIVEDGGERILVVNYSWTNVKGGSAVFDNFSMSAKQGAIALEPTLDYVDNIKKLVTNIGSEETSDDIQQGFILISDEPVTLSIMGVDNYWTDNNKPIFAYPVTVEMDLAMVES